MPNKSTYYAYVSHTDYIGIDIFLCGSKLSYIRPYGYVVNIINAEG